MCCGAALSLLRQAFHCDAAGAGTGQDLDDLGHFGLDRHVAAAFAQNGDALHPGAAGYDQFAAVMYSVYCGTLPSMMENGG